MEYTVWNVTPSIDVSITIDATPTLALDVDVPMHRRVSMRSLVPAALLTIFLVNVGRSLGMAGRSPQGGDRDGDGVGDGGGELDGDGDGDGVGVGVGV